MITSEPRIQLPISAAQDPAIVRGPRKVMGFLTEALMALLVVLLFPLAILVVGTPLALLVRILIEAVKRL